MTPIPAHVQLVAFVAFVLAEVSLPREVIWPYLIDLTIVIALINYLGITASKLGRGLLVEVPFVVFAALLPFFATGDRIVCAGMDLSLPGLWAGWAILAKGTLGVIAASVLAQLVTKAEFVAGLQRLRVPALLVEILGFTVRYLDVVLDTWRRMSVARSSRGFVATSPNSWRTLSASLGSLFIRSYERGERVHLSMMSRGYVGEMPVFEQAQTRWSHWLAASIVPVLAWAVCLSSWADRLLA